MKKIRKIDRRKFLRGCGTAMSLPLLDIMLDPAKGGHGVAPKRAAFFYIPNGVVQDRWQWGSDGGEFVLSPTLKPLQDLKEKISVYSNLDRIKVAGTDGHAQASTCWLSSAHPRELSPAGYPLKRTVDQLIADETAKHTPFRSLELSCNPYRDNKESVYFDNISWYGPGKIAPSIKNPRKLYDRLFMADSYRNHVQDVTDLILADTKSISRKLGNQDKETLDGFVTMIREIELRIEKLEKMISGADVNQPTNEILPRGEYIRLQADLMLAALQMGITNVSTFMIGPERWDASLMYEGVFPKPVQHHSMTHNQKKEEVAKELQKIDVFHLEQLSYVITRMKEIKESDGTSLFENSLLTYGAGLGDGATHQFFDLPMIVAGKGQGQIKQGRFIKCKSGTLNSNLWLTLANLMGLEIDSFADSNAVISDLWT